MWESHRNKLFIRKEGQSDELRKSTLPAHLKFASYPSSSLVPAPYNPRRVLKPTDKAYRKLEASIREFGLVEPLIWNERTGHVVGGHARLAILKAIGVTEVPVSVVRLSDAREKALNVVLNNQEAQSRYDPGRLAEVLDELAELPEFDMTGFDPDALPPLRLEPFEALPPPEELSDRVTVTLEMANATFEEIGPRLDALVAEFDLTSHVQHGRTWTCASGVLLAECRRLSVRRTGLENSLVDYGELAERFKAVLSKSTVGATPPGVRIPHSLLCGIARNFQEARQ